ncbi:MAG: poly-beta-1,6 N-acetyl-D-glucosamine synthase [Propionivibrio sp.]|uniref:poly-beta-1,6-N-acetyl-D-glucosamine synthase n=1 Tax=Propionivibrio sp. TaxID=2212460 RepID=UPI001A4A64F9|nr:poly-beta-1,6-N-acetyl-D-glucosamine synthase [Propionivibrio sp.]MBL8415741.1 poly-beta-1,6 N-acetyl-D-glucosamine synthase [Propionivibrio sp.]
MTLPALMGSFWGVMLSYVFLYPVLMSLLWMIGGVAFYFRYERYPHRIVSQPPERADYPLVAVLVPCFNEEANARETIDALMELRYPNFEVIAINDGSRDRTGEILDDLADEYPLLRVIHNVKNQGKAVGLNTAALLTHAEILVGIDGDARLDPWCLHWLVRHFDEPEVGAVTGNPRVRTRSTLLGRIQVGEFSSIVGLIKRAQRSIGLIFTVSGVIAAFRRSALFEAGFWSPDKMTEDVDITWKLQLAGWEVRFEPRALCWILMPETLKGLWNQRLRWATGGAQVIFDYWSEIWQRPRMWPVFVEYSMSILWAFCMALLVVYRIADLVFYRVDLQSAPVLMLGWTGLLIGTTCLVQMMLSLWLDRPYDQGLLKNYFWMIWYPVIYWVLGATTAVAALPAALARRSGKRARWISPDRGVSPDTINANNKR